MKSCLFTKRDIKRAEKDINDDMAQRKQEQEVLEVQLVQDMLKELGTSIQPNATILDFGCGEGKLVYQFRKKGLDAWGVDIENRYGQMRHRCIEEGIAKASEEIFRTIDMDAFRIPFEDNSFDVVISFYVLEHVQNWSASLAEIKRVLKPGGMSLHIFPSRYNFLEPHVFVPLAGVFQQRAYLACWAMLGIRNSYQKQSGWTEVADLNFEYLRHCTTYLPKEAIRKQVLTHFPHVSFVEGAYIKHHYGRVNHYLALLSRVLPCIPWLFSTFYTRVLFFKKEAADSSLGLLSPRAIRGMPAYALR